MPYGGGGGGSGGDYTLLPATDSMLGGIKLSPETNGGIELDSNQRAFVVGFEEKLNESDAITVITGIVTPLTDAIEDTLNEHTENEVIHVTEENKALWDGYEETIENIDETLTAHIGDNVIHVTQDNKTAWSGKQDALTTDQMTAVNSGITNTLVENLEDTIDDIVELSGEIVTLNTALSTHTSDTVIHVTAGNKEDWNAKQDALTAAQLNAANSGITADKVSNYDMHVGMMEEIESDLEDHIEDTVVHVTASDKIAWSGKQEALSAAQLNAANSGITSAKVSTYDGYAGRLTATEGVANGAASSISTHAGNTAIHVSTALTNQVNANTNAIASLQGSGTYKGTFNTVADIPTSSPNANFFGGMATTNDFVRVRTYTSGGVTGSAQFILSVASNGAVTYNFDLFVNQDIPIANATTAGLVKSSATNGNVATDATGVMTVNGWSALNTTVNGKAAASDLTTHTGNGNIHVTAAQKTTWDGYATTIASKANTSDLTTHTGNSVIHVTASDKTTWSGKQDKLTAGSNITITGTTIAATQPTVGNATLTLQKNGTTVSTFTANATANVNANITMNTTDVGIPLVTNAKQVEALNYNSSVHVSNDGTANYLDYNNACLIATATSAKPTNLALVFPTIRAALCFLAVKQRVTTNTTDTVIYLHGAIAAETIDFNDVQCTAQLFFIHDATAQCGLLQFTNATNTIRISNVWASGLRFNYCSNVHVWGATKVDLTGITSGTNSCWCWAYYSRVTFANTLTITGEGTYSIRQLFYFEGAHVTFSNWVITANPVTTMYYPINAALGSYVSGNLTVNGVTAAKYTLITGSVINLNPALVYGTSEGTLATGARDLQLIPQDLRNVENYRQVRILNQNLVAHVDNTNGNDTTAVLQNSTTKPANNLCFKTAQAALEAININISLNGNYNQRTELIVHGAYPDMILYMAKYQNINHLYFNHLPVTAGLIISSLQIHYGMTFHINTGSFGTMYFNECEKVFIGNISLYNTPWVSNSNVIYFNKVSHFTTATITIGADMGGSLQIGNLFYIVQSNGTIYSTVNGIDFTCSYLLNLNQGSVVAGILNCLTYTGSQGATANGSLLAVGGTYTNCLTSTQNTVATHANVLNIWTKNKSVTNNVWHADRVNINVNYAEGDDHTGSHQTANNTTATPFKTIEAALDYADSTTWQINAADVFRININGAYPAIAINGSRWTHLKHIYFVHVNPETIPSFNVTNIPNIHIYGVKCGTLTVSQCGYANVNAVTFDGDIAVSNTSFLTTVDSNLYMIGNITIAGANRTVGAFINATGSRVIFEGINIIGATTMYATAVLYTYYGTFMGRINTNTSNGPAFYLRGGSMMYVQPYTYNGWASIPGTIENNGGINLGHNGVRT
jgi:hypothetical protein